MLGYRLSLIAFTALIGTTFSSITQARELTITGPRGGTTVVNTTGQRVPNGFTVQRSFTLPNGQVFNKSSNFTLTGNGGYERNVLWTGPEGRQSTVQDVGTFQNGVLNGTRTFTFPNGKTATYQYQSQH